MSEFSLFFDLGRAHILDVQAYDHILFVIALCVAFDYKEWKRVLVLVTAFTIGHSVTLAMVALDVIAINADLIEFLIPLTILWTAILHIRDRNVTASAKKLRSNYILALVFGFIHGMGFSNYLKSLLGDDVSIVNQLLAFNLGLELGQACIVFVFFGIVYLIQKFNILNRSEWILAVCSGVIGITLTLLMDILI